jgi:hypothetical protein
MKSCGFCSNPQRAGLKMQVVYRLVAEGELTDAAIAKNLGVSLKTLQKVKARPGFAAQVEKEREAIKLEKVILTRLGIGQHTVC